MYDPEGSRGIGDGLNHSGFHPYNLNKFTRADAFPAFFENVLKDLNTAARRLKAQDERDDRARVVCVPWCNQGRHRSVAAFCAIRMALADVFSCEIDSVFFELHMSVCLRWCWMIV